MAHFIKVCKHGIVVGQCRCPGNRVKTVVDCPSSCDGPNIDAAGAKPGDGVLIPPAPSMSEWPKQESKPTGYEGTRPKEESPLGVGMNDTDKQKILDILEDLTASYENELRFKNERMAELTKQLLHETDCCKTQVRFKRHGNRVKSEIITELKGVIATTEHLAWEALGKPDGTHVTTNVHRLCERVKHLEHHAQIGSDQLRAFRKELPDLKAENEKLRACISTNGRGLLGQVEEEGRRADKAEAEVRHLKLQRRPMSSLYEQTCKELHEMTEAHNKAGLAHKVEVKGLRGLIRESYERFKSYEMGVDSEAPIEHQEFMRRLDAIGGS